VTFATDVSNWTLKADGLQRQQIQYVCFTLFKDIVMGTPVDTGRARGNWQASIGSAAGGVVNASDKSGGVTISQAQPDIEKAPGTVFYISNNLPYIYRLEFEGWSKQAPAGWIRYSIERAKQILTQLPRS
jgi:hypothetical protein